MAGYRPDGRFETGRNPHPRSDGAYSIRKEKLKDTLRNSDIASTSLSPPLKIGLQTIHPLHDIFHGTGIGETEKSLGVCAEIDPRCYPYLGLLKDIEGEMIGIPGKSFCVSQDIEGTGGFYHDTEP